MGDQNENLAKAFDNLSKAIDELLKAGRHGWVSEVAKIRDAIDRDMGSTRAAH